MSSDSSDDGESSAPSPQRGQRVLAARPVAASSDSGSSTEESSPRPRVSGNVRQALATSLDDARAGTADASSSSSDDDSSSVAQSVRRAGAPPTERRLGEPSGNQTGSRLKIQTGNLSDDDASSDVSGSVSASSTSKSASSHRGSLKSGTPSARPLKNLGTPRESKPEVLARTSVGETKPFAVAASHYSDVNLSARSPPQGGHSPDSRTKQGLWLQDSSGRWERHASAEHESTVEATRVVEVVRQADNNVDGEDKRLPSSDKQDELAERIRRMLEDARQNDLAHWLKQWRQGTLLEKESRKRALEEEEARARQRIQEEHAIEQQKEKERNAQELRAREEAFWAALAPEEAGRMRGMLQAVALYQQQLQQNERVIADLHGHVATKEKAFRTLRRRVQQSTQDTKLAREGEARARDELDRWNRKRVQYNDSSQEADLVRARHVALQDDVTRLRGEIAPARSELQSLRDRLASSEETGREQAARLAALKSKCQQATAQLKAEQLEELAELRAQQSEELTRLDVQYQAQAANMRAQHAEEASRIRRMLEGATQRRDRQRKERDEAGEQLVARQREGAQLQQQWADARTEVMDISTQVKACQVQPHIASQLGLASVDASMMSMSFHGLGDDHRLEAEVQMARQRCRSLERECARTHDALEKKQSECERWRRRGLASSYDSGRLLAVTSGAADEPGSAAPFTLGPADGQVGSLALTAEDSVD